MNRRSRNLLCCVVLFLIGAGSLYLVGSTPNSSSASSFSEEKNAMGVAASGTRNSAAITEKKESVLANNVLNENASRATTEPLLQMQENSLDKRALPNKKMDVFMAPIPAKRQIQSFMAEQGATVVGEKGTEVYFPPSALLNPDGTAAKGKVEVALEEYYTLEDQILGGLSTMSAGEQLKTAGTIFLQAKNEKGEELKMASNKTLMYFFPLRGKQPLDTKMILYEGIPSSLNIVDWAPMPSILYTSEGFKIGSEALGYCGFTFIQKGGPVLEKGIPSFKEGNVFWKNFTAQCAYNRKDFKEISKIFRKKIDPTFAVDFKNFEGKGRNLSAQEECLVDELSLFMRANRKNAALDSLPKFLQFIFSSFDVKTSLTSSFYVFEGRNLGFINVDRLYHLPEKKRTEAIVARTSKMERVQLVLPSLSSILEATQNGAGHKFTVLPKSEDVLVLATKVENNETLYSMAIVNTDKLSVWKPNYTIKQPENLQMELAAKLKQMNPLRVE